MNGINEIRTNLISKFLLKMTMTAAVMIAVDRSPYTKTNI